MNTNHQLKNISRSLLAMLCLAGGLVACTTTESNPAGGTGGANVGVGAGGSTTGPGGSTGTAGTSGSVATDGVACPVPTAALITDFTYVPADGGTASTTEVHFGNSTTLGGGEFVYPAATSTSAYPITSDMTQSNWHITGNIGDYSGFGLYFDNCSRVNASAYKGISFKISGTVASPTGSSITFGVGTIKNTISAAWINAHGGTGAVNAGSCTPTTGTSQYYQTGCGENTKTIPVTATPTTQSILWTDFTGGLPETSVTPSDILSIHWNFLNPTGVGTTSVTPYAADIVLDDLSFIQ